MPRPVSGRGGFELELDHRASRTPQDVAAFLNASIVKALELPEVKESYEKLGFVPQPSTREELASFMKSEMQKYAEVIKRAGIQPNRRIDDDAARKDEVRRIHDGGLNYHIAGWRHPESYADAGSNIQRWIEFARILERGKLDMLFVADTIGVPGAGDPQYLTSTPTIDKLEPFTLLAALSSMTRNIGLVATSATAYNEPYFVARVLASLDHITGGRAGSNLVTGGNAEDAANFSVGTHAAHGDRYERAEEFVDVVADCGEARPRCISARQIVGTLSRSRQASHAQSQGQVFFGKGSVGRITAAARPSGDRPGRHVGAGAKIVFAGGGRGVHRPVGD